MNTIKELTKLSNGKELDIEYPIRLHDKDGNEVYYENPDGHWRKKEYEDGKQVYCEDAEDCWITAICYLLFTPFGHDAPATLT